MARTDEQTTVIVSFRHTTSTACRINSSYSPALAFSAAIHLAIKRPAPCSAILHHSPSSWAAVVRRSALIPKTLWGHPGGASSTLSPASQRSSRPPPVLRTSRTSAVSCPPCAPQIPRTGPASYLCWCCCCLKKNQNAPRPSEHPPVRGEKNVKTFSCFSHSAYWLPTRKITLNGGQSRSWSAEQGK